MRRALIRNPSRSGQAGGIAPATPAPVPATRNSSAIQSPATSSGERVAIAFPSAIADPDAWQASLNPADKAELAALLQDSPDPQARVRRILSIGYAADVTGASPYDVSHQWDGFGRSQFSTDPRGLGMMMPREGRCGILHRPASQGAQ